MSRMHKDCKECALRSQCRDSAYSWIFLFIGIIASVAMRLVALFMHLDPYWAKFFWYIGVSFFMVFFIYRYKVSRQRAVKVQENDLVNKVIRSEQLDPDERQLVGEILCGLTSRKERVNFAFIFVLSAVTLLIAAVLDLGMGG